MIGQRVAARFFCAVCGSDIASETPRTAPLGKNGAMVHVCDACMDERPREKRGPERGYEGAGVSVATFGKDLGEALRKKVGDVEYDAMMERERQQGVSYFTKIQDGKVKLRGAAERSRIQAQLAAKRQAQAFAVEGHRLHLTGAKAGNDKAIARAAARDSDARRIDTVKSALKPYRVTLTKNVVRVWFKAASDPNEGIFLETKFRVPEIAAAVAQGIARGIGARKTVASIRAGGEKCEWARKP